MTAEYRIEGEVAVITLNNPPVNGLGWATRQAIVNGVARAQEDGAIKAVVLTGAGRAFSGGADIREFGTPKSAQAPNLLSVIEAIEQSAKPVIAAVHSVCMGGGLELALGAHYRVAAPGCSVALPEVKLGLIPGAGGTQRLPRVLGVDFARRMIVSGETFQSEYLAQLPAQKLFDRMAASASSLLDEALAFAREVAAAHVAGPRVPWPLVRHLPCERMPGGYFELARDDLPQWAKSLPAPRRCIDAIEAATEKSFADGMAFEREIFLHLMTTPESKSLRYLFAAQRAAAKVPGLDTSVQPRVIKSVAVVGASDTGAQIARVFLRAGVPVLWFDQDSSVLEQAWATLEGLDPPLTTTQAQALSDADLVLEAVGQSEDVKKAAWAQWGGLLKPGAIWASHTASVDIQHLASTGAHSKNVVGLCFVGAGTNAAWMEILRTPSTAPDVLATLLALAKKLKKMPVVAQAGQGGGISCRLMAQYHHQGHRLLEQGCTPLQINHALEAFGMLKGPFHLDEGQDGQPLPKASEAPGEVTCAMSDQDIVQQVVWAWVNEAARMLEAGVASKASDIDVIATHLCGFPMGRGGPWHYAQEYGLPLVIAAMQQMAQRVPADAAFWTPAPHLVQCAEHTPPVAP